MSLQLGYRKLVKFCMKISKLKGTLKYFVSTYSQTCFSQFFGKYKKFIKAKDFTIWQEIFAKNEFLDMQKVHYLAV